MKTVVVVLAGGSSVRFGSDKLEHDLDGASLLDRALASIPADLPVLVVGPSRDVARRVRFVREDPPGGGPGAGLVRGLRAALELEADILLTLPGDAPGAGRAVPVLQAALEPDTQAVVGVDADGHEQSLQLGLRAVAARALIDAAGEQAGAGMSVRRMLTALDPLPVRVPLGPADTFDIDTREQAGIWRAGRSEGR